MPVVRSAGILLYRRRGGVVEFYLGHPGGPFFIRKDEGVWGIPKGQVEPPENPQDAALREFLEETGIDLRGEALVSLGSVKQRGGKEVHAWACEWARIEEPPAHSCNTFALEWPPKSGRFTEFPELDRAQFFPEAVALKKINESQVQFIERLKAML